MAQTGDADQILFRFRGKAGLRIGLSARNIPISLVAVSLVYDPDKWE
jgi:hypothetical protein